MHMSYGCGVCIHHTPRTGVGFIRHCPALICPPSGLSRCDSGFHTAQPIHLSLLQFFQLFQPSCAPPSPHHRFAWCRVIRARLKAPLLPLLLTCLLLPSKACHNPEPCLREQLRGPQTHHKHPHTLGTQPLLRTSYSLTKPYSQCSVNVTGYNGIAN